MTLKAGDTAPDFTLPDHHGEPQTLSKLLTNGPVVLFFYPQANTPGCTVQACHFRDLTADFDAVGAQIVGVSRDSIEAQKAFVDKRGFGYPLLADTDRAVAAAYGVKGGLLGLSPVKRSTFVIGADGIVIESFASEVNMNAHADKALAALEALRA